MAKAHEVDSNKEEFYLLTPLGKKEKELCKKWNLLTSANLLFFDPNKSFEELTGEGSSEKVLREWAKELFNRYSFVEGLKGSAVRKFNWLSIPEQLVEGSNLPGENIFLHIDFSKVSSINSIKNEVSRLLEQGFNFYYSGSVTELLSKFRGYFLSIRKTRYKR